MFPPSHPVTKEQVYESLSPSSTIIAFINTIMVIGLDPLICLWIALSHCYPFALDVPAFDIFRLQLFGTVDNKFVHHMLTGCEYSWPNDADKHEREYYGNKLGMWQVIETEPEIYHTHFVPYQQHVTTYTRTNEFIERTATRAFLYMRTLACKDVAGIIARMVAKMYLDDYKWMQRIPCSVEGAEMIRIRVMRQLQHNTFT